MNLHDKTKLDTLVCMNQLLSKINSNFDSLNTGIELDELQDKKLSKKLLKLKALMNQAAEISKEIEKDFYGF